MGPSDKSALASRANTGRNCVSQLWHNSAKTVCKLLKISGRACKPDSVEHAKAYPDDHSSRLQFALQLQQPTRGLLSSTARLLNAGRSASEGVRRTFVRLLGEPGRLSPPIWPCT